MHGGLRVELFEDDTEGYPLNATTPSPGWFVLYEESHLVRKAPHLPTPRLPYEQY
jgi:hypothetical protein